MKKMKLVGLPLVLSVVATQAHALPIDWRGAFGVDTTLMKSFRHIEALNNNAANTGTTNSGSQEAPLGSGNHDKASFQSYIFRLNPIMVVNDSASIKGEITTGYGRGGMMGDSGTESKQGNMGNSLYFYNTSSDNGSSTQLLLTKLYAELYSDTATYVVGRQSAQWGLGLVYNSGDGLWDRHTYVRDGITMKIKFGNFHAAPYYAILNSGTTLTRATKATEYGTTLTYDNPERDLTLGLVYGKREHDAFSDGNKTDINNTGTAHSWGKSEIKITDIYFKKTMGRFNLGVEVPMLSGEMGYLYNDGTLVKYSAKAIVGESSYKLNDNWKIGLNGGTVSGDAGSKGNFKAMFLNPNYQFANILFRYNLYAISNPSTYNIWDSYVTNSQFVKAQVSYTGEKWDTTCALIYAVANETAKGGATNAYNHTNNKLFVSNVAQSDKMGTEFDLNLNFRWNADVEVGANFGYLFTGDYWAYTNDATKPNQAKDTWLMQARTGISF